MAPGRKTGGRQKGTPNKKTAQQKADAQAMALGLLSDAAYQKNLLRRLREGKAPHMETLLHQYGWGKPREIIALEGSAQRPVRVVHEYHRDG